MSDDYARGDWAADMAALYIAKQAPPACPRCGRTGFYGPRWDGATRLYRGCKFCGFWQDVGQPPVPQRATVHGCAQSLADVIAGAPQIWWVSPHEKMTHCPHCDKDFEVEKAIMPSPRDDPTHAWWKVPQGMTHEESRAFWKQQLGSPREHL